MENNGNESSRSMTSLIPVFLMGAAVIFLLQYFEKDIPGKKSQSPDTEQTQSNQVTQKPSASVATSSGLSDLEFPKGNGKSIEIDGGFYAVRLSEKGGRVDKFFLESNEDIAIPESVIAEQDDPLARKKNALEVTRGNGMDFQPHLYFWNSRLSKIWQIANPALNDAKYKMSGPFVDDKTGMQEVRFTLPVVFKGHHLEIIKIYRFFKNEYFFRQITAIRNLEKKEFVLGGDMFFKPFGDIGPNPESLSSRVLASYGRFYGYNDSLEHSANITGGGRGMGCGMPGCSQKSDTDFEVFSEHPNTLGYMGSTSRYFFGYDRFLSAENDSASSPDGIVLVKKIDPKGQETFTAIFDNMTLAPAEKIQISFGNVNGNIADDGSIKKPEESNFAAVRNAQSRSDILTIDNQVYFGVRRDESHHFKNEDLMNAEFGETEPDAQIRDVIYTSGFLVLFSKIRDGIIWLMRFLYQYIGNYGWVIIIIATSFKLATWPLNQMQAKSMKRMSRLKPEIEGINEKYKDDPNEKQKKIMELYKKHNVNPAKGCLPMLIQLPVFIALYSAFSESVDLWRSPFILWMTDLSQPDTIFVIKNLLMVQNFHVNILPLIMVATQLTQQLTTTMAADPQQKIVMYIMPVIMIFFFWNLPSGVTLYWTVQNIITILWQVLGSRLSDDEEGQAA